MRVAKAKFQIMTHMAVLCCVSQSRHNCSSLMKCLFTYSGTIDVHQRSVLGAGSALRPLPERMQFAQQASLLGLQPSCLSISAGVTGESNAGRS